MMEPFALLRSLGRAALLLSGAMLLHCDNASCEKLRDDLYAQKLTWQACKTSLDCEIIGGNMADCSGVMSCNLAINVRYRKEAERRIASLPEESVDCHKCGSPNCPEGEIPYCDPVIKTCTIVKDFLGEGGGIPTMGFTSGGARGSGGTGSGGSPGSSG